MALAYKIRDARTYEWDVSEAVESYEALRTALTEAFAQPVQVSLTDEQIQEIYISEYNKGHHGRDFENLFARGIERAHHIGGDK
jgi:hypothetical protein